MLEMSNTVDDFSMEQEDVMSQINDIATETLDNDINDNNDNIINNDNYNMDYDYNMYQ